MTTQERRRDFGGQITTMTIIMMLQTFITGWFADSIWGWRGAVFGVSLSLTIMTAAGQVIAAIRGNE